MNKELKIDENLIELVKSIRNRAVAFLIIYECKEASIIGATLLEDMAKDCQEVLEYCVVKE